MSTIVSTKIGIRLREERERIGMSQHLLAAKAGISRMSQVNYESGKRSPDAIYLLAVFEAGIDVGFVLTGKRSGAPDFYKLASAFVLEKIELQFGMAADVVSFAIESLAEAATDEWLNDPELQNPPLGRTYDMRQSVYGLPIDDLLTALSDNAELLRDIYGTLNTVLLDHPMQIPAKKRLLLVLMLFKSLKGVNDLTGDVFYNTVFDAAQIASDGI
jgi:transcriptional regulator with XRE-family HTH domain